MLPITSCRDNNASQRGRSEGAIARDASQRGRSEGAIARDALRHETLKVADATLMALRREEDAKLRARSEEAVAQLRAEALLQEALKVQYGSTDEQERRSLRRARSSEKLQHLITRVEDLRTRAFHVKDADKETLTRSLLNESNATEEPSKRLSADARRAAANVFRSIVNHDLPAAVAVVLTQVECYGWESVKWRSGVTLLHWAAGHGLSDLCKHVIRLGANPLAKDDELRTPIDHASAAGHNHTWVVLQTSEISRMMDAPTNPASLALSPRSVECLELVKSKGWRSISWAKEHTLLHVAARKCLPALCAQLLEYGADLHHCNHFGKRPIDYLSIAPEKTEEVPQHRSHNLPSWMTMGESQSCARHRPSTMETENRIPEQPHIEKLSLGCALPSAASMPNLRLGQGEEADPLSDSRCLSDESPPPTARIRGIRFRGSASLESIHFIDTDAPANLHLSLSQKTSTQPPYSQTVPEGSQSNSAAHQSTHKTPGEQSSQATKLNLLEFWEAAMKENSKPDDLDAKKAKVCSQQDLSNRVMARVAQIEQRCQSSASRPAPKLSSDVRGLHSSRPDTRLGNRRVGRFFTVQVAGG